MASGEGKRRSMARPLSTCRQRARDRLPGVVMMGVVMMVMVLARGKSRCSNHQHEQGGEQNFLHALRVALSATQRYTTFC